MKELSIKEKAKRYDEAIERAKLELNSPDKRLIEYIFPELKESEDEKIKKLLIGGLELHGNEIFAQGELDMILAWLKSLKERYTWKPSDEQMGIIEALINNRSFQRRHLDSLYNDLKKLREE